MLKEKCNQSNLQPTSTTTSPGSRPGASTEIWGTIAELKAW